MPPDNPNGVGALRLTGERPAARETAGARAEPRPELRAVPAPLGTEPRDRAQDRANGRAHDDGALVQRAAAGDEAAFRALYQGEFDFVLRTCIRFGLSESDAEDAAQETFQIAHRKLARFTSGRFSTWLYRIAANVVADVHRRRRVREALLSLWMPKEEPLAPAPDEPVHQAEAARQVREVLARMSAKKREVFVLYELEGLPGDEIAERIGCNLATVWTRLHYARQEFKRIAIERGIAAEHAEETRDCAAAPERDAALAPEGLR